MSLFKRGRTWYAEIRFGGKHHREAVGPRKEDAQAVLAKWKENIRHGRFPELRRVKPILFKDHAKEVLAQHYSKKRSHLWAKTIIQNRLNPFFGELFLGAITPKTISEHMTRRRDEGVSNGTINNERAIVSKILSLAVRWERLVDNPCKRVEKLETPKGRLRYLSHEEADKLIEKAPKHLKPVIITALETGGRLSEVLGLRWEAVDLAQGLLIFDQRNTKSGKQREVPITPTLASTLKAIPRSIRTDRVFVRYGKPMRNVRTAFDLALKGADLGDGVTFHTLRHSFASWFMMRGGDIYRLQKYLGHSTIAMTERYAHLSPTYLRDGVPMMGRQPAPAAGDGPEASKERLGGAVDGEAKA